MYDDLLRAQWSALRSWLGRTEVAAAASRPSVLEGWTVADLVAHVGRSFTPLRLATATTEAPLSLAAYVAAYPAAAGEIAAGTRSLAAELAGDSGDVVALLAGVDRLAADNLAVLSALPDPVLGPRGPLRRDDLLLTRLVELVVHGDDFARSLPELDGPHLLSEAVEAVAEVLAGVYLERTGSGPAMAAADLAWVRRATGRTPSDDPALPLL